jgi:hypothetical protein
MAEAIKRGKGSESFQDASIDLSAGFVPKNTPAAGEPVRAELTPDSFTAQPEAHVAPDDSEPKPIAGEPEITWRWAAEADMPALQLLHFQAEIAVGKEMYLPELSFPGAIAVARKDGNIVGGLERSEFVQSRKIQFHFMEVVNVKQEVIHREGIGVHRRV